MKSILLLALLAILAVTAQAQTTCGNTVLGVSGCDGLVGKSPIRVSDGSLQRSVIDLKAFGGVGEIPLEFRRTYFSRYLWWGRFSRMGSSSWRSNWDQNLYLQNSGNSYFYMDEVGNGYKFVRVGLTREFRTGQFADPSALVLWQWASSPNKFTLVHPDGKEMDFERVPTSSLPNFVRLAAVRDTYGNQTTLTYITGTANALGRVEDAAGRGLNLTYDSDGYLSQVTADDGRFVQFTYAASSGGKALMQAIYDDATTSNYTYGGVLEPDGVSRPLLLTAQDVRYGGNKVGASEGYTYNPTINGQVLREYNPTTGNTTLQIGYPMNSPRIITSPDGGIQKRKLIGVYNWETTDEVGRLEKKTYSGNKLLTLQDKRGNTTTYVRDALARPTKITNPDGTFRTFVYNSKGQVTSETDELSRTTTSIYDAGFRLTRRNHPDGTFEEWTYNGFSQPLTHKDRRGYVTTYTYNSLGDLTSTTDPLGNVTTFVYDTAGRLTSATDSHGLTTTMTYNAKGLVTRITHPDATFIEKTYDTVGNLESETNEVGATTTYFYDEHNRLVQILDPLLRTRTFQYGATVGCGSCGAGQELVRFEWDAKGGLIERNYDVAGQLLWVKDQTGAQTSYTYDGNSNPTQITDANGKIWAQTFDNRDRKTSATDPLGLITSWTYDAVGNNTKVIRPNATQTVNTFDAVNRLLTTKNPNLETTTFTYDGGNNLTSLTDARGSVSSFEYDALNRRTKFIYPGGGTFEAWIYNDTAVAGSVWTVYTARDGSTMSCTYDNRRRDTFCNFSDAATPDITKTYDAVGLLSTASTSVASHSYAYDAANQLLSETTSIPSLASPSSFAVSYDYDLNGNRQSLTYPDGTVVAYTHTACNEVQDVVADGPPPLASYGYDANGNRITKSLENGITTDYTYDNASRLTQVKNSLGATTMAQFDYQLNTVGNRTQKAVSGSVPNRTENYTFDPADQVTGSVATPVSGVPRTETFTYDAVGNRTTVVEATPSSPAVTTSYTANALNQYTLIGANTPIYDTKGNLTSINGWTYTYDSRNRLLGATNGSTTVATAYDYRNRPVSRTVNGTTTYFIYDDWSLIDERNASGTQVQKYIHGPQTDELLAKINGTGTIYYSRDGLGSTVALTNASGAVVESYAYDVFGVATVFDPSAISIPQSAIGNRFLFTGREFISEASLYDYRNRVYTPELGRFLQNDPIRFEAGDVNLYRYVANDPVNYWDPLGLDGDSSAESGGGEVYKWTKRVLDVTKKVVGNLAKGQKWYGGNPPSGMGSAVTKAGGAVIGPMLQVANKGDECYKATIAIRDHNLSIKNQLIELDTLP